MTLTILSAVREVEAAPDDMKSIAKAMSTGSLRGARVIQVLYYPSF